LRFDAQDKVAVLEDKVVELTAVGVALGFAL
jgi:hypothetical protein